jgi:hypothetical protein
MAKSVVCDICGVEAVDTITAKSNFTHPLVKDVCEVHLAEYKKIMRAFLKQDMADIEVVNDEVIVAGKH